jgi:hypothetical protein
MQGTIRLITGLIITMSAVGGMEHQPEASLLAQTLAAVIGIALMAWAARDINRNTNKTLRNL